MEQGVGFPWVKCDSADVFRVCKVGVQIFFMVYFGYCESDSFSVELYFLRADWWDP